MTDSNPNPVPNPAHAPVPFAEGQIVYWRRSAASPNIIVTLAKRTVGDEFWWNTLDTRTPVAESSLSHIPAPLQPGQRSYFLSTTSKFIYRTLKDRSWRVAPHKAGAWTWSFSEGGWDYESELFPDTALEVGDEVEVIGPSTHGDTGRIGVVSSILRVTAKGAFRLPTSGEAGDHFPASSLRLIRRPVKAAPAAVKPDAPAGSWIVWYEDASVAPEHFTDESCAVARHREQLQNWACHLFKRVEPGEVAPAGKGLAALKWTRALLGVDTDGDYTSNFRAETFEDGQIAVDAHNSGIDKAYAYGGRDNDQSHVETMRGMTEALMDALRERDEARAKLAALEAGVEGEPVEWRGNCDGKIRIPGCVDVYGKTPTDGTVIVSAHNAALHWWRGHLAKKLAEKDARIKELEAVVKSLAGMAKPVTQGEQNGVDIPSKPGMYWFENPPGKYEIAKIGVRGGIYIEGASWNRENFRKYYRTGTFCREIPSPTALSELESKLAGVEVAIAQAVAAEREACAKVAEDSDNYREFKGNTQYAQMGDARDTQDAVAAAIRARGQEGGGK